MKYIITLQIDYNGFHVNIACAIEEDDGWTKTPKLLIIKILVMTMKLLANMIADEYCFKVNVTGDGVSKGCSITFFVCSSRLETQKYHNKTINELWL